MYSECWMQCSYSGLHWNSGDFQLLSEFATAKPFVAEAVRGVREMG